MHQHKGHELLRPLAALHHACQQLRPPLCHEKQHYLPDLAGHHSVFAHGHIVQDGVNLPLRPPVQHQGQKHPLQALADVGALRGGLRRGLGGG
eukprot:CAMPEP_0173353304 /NCGR_PEP_ID=MMETSP1144-20121109/16538_1 /TAXON_ID=483371 /ORGANISM="non described non described, Strain CCMP2298" /LENGTH=92 /DNA_ID=CAMNT_0014301693 /DNA_START=200 /DNA_END=474 /DNA_ORIENTATION=+